ncbi:MAG: hypothetical protein K2G32_08340 [Oscillospiraceae bacterium]|nr:hypothetical protein [Oscillospiraceae bacterium]
MSEKSKTFTHNCSNKQQAELKKIRDKYTPRNESKIEQLRRLDASATKPGAAISTAVGIIGALMLGIGMCCILLWSDFILGIAAGAVGIVAVIMALPMYLHITKKRREKLAPEILKLANELKK